MRATIRKSLIAGLAVLGGVMPLDAQQRSELEQENNIRYGAAAGEFLLLPVGGRATALGSAYTALGTDISALYWNPAGVALMPTASAMVSHLEYVAETTYSWFGAGTPLGNGERVVGLQVGVFGFDDQPEYTVEQPDGTGRTYSVSNSIVGLTYAQQFNDRFSFGITGKYVSEDLAGVRASTLAADIGTNYHTELGGQLIRGSFVISNLGGGLEHEGSKLEQDVPRNDPDLPPGTQPISLRTAEWNLPVTFKVGLAYDVLSSESSRLTAVGEFSQPTGNDVSGALGAEYAMQRLGDSPFSVALRGGFAYEPSNVDLDGSSMNGMQGDGLSLGGGIGYHFSADRAALVDYAYRDLGLLGGRHLFSLSVNW